MQLKITGHHCEVSPALREHVVNKLKRTERHFDQVTDAHVVLTVEKLRHKAEATVTMAGARIHVDAVEDDMYAAIDSLSDKLERRVRKHKEKTTDHHQR